MTPRARSNGEATLQQWAALQAAARWVETSIEPLTPVAASVNRLPEVDYLSQAVGDL